MREIKQSTPANIMVFMADNTDHITGKTGLTLTVTISKDGGAFSSISPTVTERGNGWYNIALTASDTDTIGDLVVRATATGADPAERVLNVVSKIEADTYSLVDTFDQNIDTTISSRASQTSVNAIPTNPLLDNDSRLNNLDTTISSRASQTSVNAIPTNPLLTNDSRLNNLDATISSRSTLTASDVWNYATRTLTSFGNLVADIWNYSTRTLTSFGTLVADIWGYSTRTLTSFGTLVSDIWSYITRTLTSIPIAFPVMQGQVYTALAVNKKITRVVRGDGDITVPFDLKGDYTGWTPYFGAKKLLGDTEYYISPKECVWIDASKGQGYFILTTTDTAQIGSYHAEIELRKGTSTLTAMQFKLEIVKDVID